MKAEAKGRQTLSSKEIDESKREKTGCENGKERRRAKKIAFIVKVLCLKGIAFVISHIHFEQI